MAMIRAAPATCAPWIVAVPTPPQPMTATVAPGSHLGGVDRGAEAGREPAADERELVGREIGVDRDARRLVDRHHVGEAADARSCALAWIRRRASARGPGEHLGVACRRGASPAAGRASTCRTPA